MRIYHTETVEDYDALMVELEEQGYKWNSGSEMRKLRNYWTSHKSEMCVMVDCCGYATYGKKNYFELSYQDTPIIKYKAKVDASVKFTKENVLNLTDKWIQNKIVSFPDLQNEIKELDDTPEKVVVPKCFDEWFKEIVVEYPITDSSKRFALWKLSQQGFGHGFERANGEKIPYDTDLGKWLFKNRELAINAILNGYTIEPEQLYYIPLRHLETLDGTPEKVVVPRFVAEWIEWNKETGADLKIMLKSYRHYCDNIKSYSEGVYGKEAVQWYIDNPYKFIKAYENGYTIEPEQLYYIPLPHLQLSDGTLQLLSKRKGHKEYSAQFPSSWLQQSFTKAELEQVPEIYKPFAVPVKEEGQ